MTGRSKTNGLQGEEEGSSIKHQYSFNPSPLLANLPESNGCTGLLLGPGAGHSIELKYNGTGLFYFLHCSFKDPFYLWQQILLAFHL